MISINKNVLFVYMKDAEMGDSFFFLKYDV